MTDRMPHQLECSACDSPVEIVPTQGDVGPIGIALECECDMVSLDVSRLSLVWTPPSSWVDSDE